ncbi:hypothetical protein ACLI4Y_00350 [Natrialbaceae archaeon A-CW3]
MKRGGYVESLRSREWNPRVAGVVAGLLTGFLGLLATLILIENPIGGLVGAIGCGITVAYVSQGRLRTIIVDAAVADVVSSIVFYVFVLAAFLLFVAVTEGLLVILAGGVFTIWYVIFGGPFAVFVGGISLVITCISATVTALVT